MTIRYNRNVWGLFVVVSDETGTLVPSTWAFAKSENIVSKLIKSCQGCYLHACAADRDSEFYNLQTLGCFHLHGLYIHGSPD